MRRPAIQFALTKIAPALLALCLADVAFADQPPASEPTTQQEVQAKLKTFDQEAVAAARHYYESPKIKDGMLAMIGSLAPAIIASEEKTSGKTLSDGDRAKIIAALNKAMAENFDFLLGMNMVAALEVLSKDQLVAMDRFYSSPAGQSILEKMPALGQRLPAMMRAFMPKFMMSVKDNLKSAGFANP